MVAVPPHICSVSESGSKVVPSLSERSAYAVSVAVLPDCAPIR